jgi:hypothetical protein
MPETAAFVKPNCDVSYHNLTIAYQQKISRRHASSNLDSQIDKTFV